MRPPAPGHFSSRNNPYEKTSRQSSAHPSHRHRRRGGRSLVRPVRQAGQSRLYYRNRARGRYPQGGQRHRRSGRGPVGQRGRPGFGPNRKTLRERGATSSLRALIKKLEQINDHDIVKLEVPNAEPIVYTMDEHLKIINKQILRK